MIIYEMHDHHYNNGRDGVRKALNKMQPEGCEFDPRLLLT